MTDRRTASTITDTELDQLYDRAARADVELARIRALHVNGYGLCDECTSSHGVPWPCPTIQALDQPAAGPAATQTTDRKEQPMPAITTGLVVQPYRNDRGDPVWVFRCWGTDTCDGWLSLDHTSQQSAERARDRHVTEEHTS